jgi:tRNA G18 (ribose-2'-O)-methylase SpoU/alpha-N-acetylglucosamine transferase
MMPQEKYRMPTGIKRADGTSRFAFVTLLMLNDSYLPGVLMLAYALRRQNTKADLVCMITEEITPDARYALGLLFDHVVMVEKIFVPYKRRQERQYIPYVFTRMNALRLGKDGDLGFKYEKLVALDADVLPLKHYDHLFLLDTPAGIINEQKSYFLDYDSDGKYIIPRSVETTGTWKWHQVYDGICPHGHRIPKEITDRVEQDPSNMGVNSSLLVFEPSMDEFRNIKEDICRPDVRRLISDLFEWPDMQYLTMRWSGKWTNVDLRFSGFSGYPSMSVLFGTHYAGLKPWQFRKAKAMARYGRYDDFQLWFKEYTAMVTTDYPKLQKVKRLRVLRQEIQRFNDGLVSHKDTPDSTSTDYAFLEGHISIQAALEAGSRDVHTIYLRRGRLGQTVARLEGLAQAAGVPIERVDDDTVSAYAGGRTHGGVVARVGPRRFVPLEALLPSHGQPFIVMLDGVEDPFNFGAALRALYAAGLDGLVVRPRNWMSAASIVARTSAGASELIPTALVESAHEAAAFFRAQGLTIGCTASQKRALSIYEADLSVPLFLVIGGEKRGITRSFIDQADLLLRIPYGRDFKRSLGTAAAAAVLAFEIMRQRSQNQPAG